MRRDARSAQRPDRASFAGRAGPLSGLGYYEHALRSRIDYRNGFSNGLMRSG